MAFKEYGNYDALGLAELVRNKQVSASELLDEAIARTEKVNPRINAVVVRHDDYARAQIQHGLPDGPFSGVPFLLKDLEYLADTRTTSGASALKDYVADHNGTLAGRFGRGPDDLRQDRDAGIRPDADHRDAAVRADPQPVESGALLGRIVRRRGGGRGGAHPPRGPCQRRRRLDPYSGRGVRRVRPEADAGAHAAGAGPRRRLGRILLQSRRQHQRPRQRGDAGRHPWSRSLQPLCRAAAGAAYLEEVGREPGRLRIFFTDKSPYGDAIDPEVAAAVRGTAKLLEQLGHHVEERAPSLPVDPAAVMATIVAANTALTVRLLGARLGRAVTDQDFEKLTTASAHNAGKSAATDYVAAQLGAFQISRSLAEFFADCDVFLAPTLCTPALRIGELNTMSDDLSHISPVLRRYMPGTSMFNMSGQPSMSMPLAWNAAGLPLGMMFTARFGDEATLFRLAAQLEQARPWKDRTPPVSA